VTGFNTIVHFSNSSLLIICNQINVYAQGKFQSDMPITLGVMALERVTTKRLNWTASIEKKYYRHLQKWTQFTTGRSHNAVTCTNVFVMNRGIYVLMGGMFYPVPPSFTMHKDEICDWVQYFRHDVNKWP